MMALEEQMISVISSGLLPCLFFFVSSNGHCFQQTCRTMSHLSRAKARFGTWDFFPFLYFSYEK